MGIMELFAGLLPASDPGRRNVTVLGLPDPGIWTAYPLCIPSMLLRVLWASSGGMRVEEPPREIRCGAGEEDKVEGER